MKSNTVENEYLKRCSQSKLTEEENSELLRSVKYIKIFYAIVAVGHFGVIALLISLFHELLFFMIISVSVVLSSLGVLTLFIWFKQIKKVNLDIADGYKYTVTGVITKKDFETTTTSASSNTGSSTGSTNYYIHIDNALKVKVTKDNYFDLEVGHTIQAFISKIARLTLGEVKTIES